MKASLKRSVYHYPGSLILHPQLFTEWLRAWKDFFDDRGLENRRCRLLMAKNVAEIGFNGGYGSEYKPDDEISDVGRWIADNPEKAISYVMTSPIFEEGDK